MRIRLIFAALLFLACASAQDAAKTESSAQPASIKSTSQQVLLDMIVRDKKERFVRDLSANDVEVLEDGVPQSVKAFRFVEGREAVATEREKVELEKKGTKIQALPEINVISIIFEQMSPRSRLYAQQAATEFVNHQIGPHTYIGVFSLDYKLNALEQYTHDTTKVLAAINKAASGNYSDFRRISDNVLTNAQIVLARTITVPAANSTAPADMRVSFIGGDQAFASPSASVAGAEMGSPNSQQVQSLAYVEQQQLEGISSQVGWRSLEGLMNIVRAESKLPGRKTVLLLSEGLTVPPQADELFRAIVSAANRANVSVYAIDVTGLTTTSPTRAGIDRLGGVTNSSSDQITEADGTANGKQPFDYMREAHQDDNMLLALTADQQSRLRELAEDTGGFLIANTNDLRKPLDRIMEDAHTHYELAYTPSSQNYDGKFRKIEVRLKKSNLHVQSRNGYFALPLLNGEPIQPYEQACLQALDKSPRPDDFPFVAKAIRFQPQGREIQHEVVFEVPMKNVTFTEVSNEKTGSTKIRTHLSFTALVKDLDGQVVAKVSRDAGMEFPVERKDEHRRGNFIFNQPFRVPPGRYTLEAAVVDRESDEASVVRSVLVVPAAAATALSDLVLVRRTEPASQGADLNDPLLAGDTRVIPALDNKAPAGASVPLYFVLYPKSAGQKPDVTIELYQSGKLLTAKPAELAAPASDGAYRVLTAISPTPGSYEVRVHVKDGGATATQVLPIIVGM